MQYYCMFAIGSAPKRMQQKFDLAQINLTNLLQPNLKVVPQPNLTSNSCHVLCNNEKSLNDKQPKSMHTFYLCIKLNSKKENNLN